LIVVDASVVVEAVAGTSRRNLEPLQRIARDASLAPQVLDLAVLSALRGLLRREVIVEPVAHNSLWHLARLPIRRVSQEPLLERCWELRDNLTAYDACYVALAEVTGATLLTRDRRLAGAPGVRCEIELLE